MKEKIRTYIITDLLKNKSIANINDETALISGGLMDSISTMLLVTFLEKEFCIEFEAHEVDRDNFDSISIITKFVEQKLI